MVATLPLLASMATGVLVGIGIVATRFAIDQTDPSSLALLRYAIALVLLLPAVLASAKVRFRGRDLAPIALLGIGQFGVLIMLLNYGLQFISSGLAALIFATMPLWALTLGAILGNERMTGFKTGGVLLTIAGVGFAVYDHFGLADLHESAWLGGLAVLASAMVGALCSVLYRPYLRRYPTLQVSGIAMLASVIFLTIPAGWAGFFASWPVFTLAGWAAVLIIGLASAIGYYIWLWALAHTTPTRVTVFMSLSPLTATLLGWALLGEPLTVEFLLGTGLVALGLWLAHRTTDARRVEVT
ncbi:MAG: DMT family transporter [Pseudomonadota bacterium]